MRWRSIVRLRGRYHLSGSAVIGALLIGGCASAVTSRLARGTDLAPLSTCRGMSPVETRPAERDIPLDFQDGCFPPSIAANRSARELTYDRAARRSRASRRARWGKDSIGQAHGGHDDLANTEAGVMAELLTRGSTVR